MIPDIRGKSGATSEIGLIQTAESQIENIYDMITGYSPRFI